jgi:Flp pilus assembly pilin Flp
MFSWMSARFSASDRGASAVEYGLIVFAIAAVVIVAVFAFGTGDRGHVHRVLRHDPHPDGGQRHLHLTPSILLA